MAALRFQISEYRIDCTFHYSEFEISSLDAIIRATPSSLANSLTAILLLAACIVVVGTCMYLECCNEDVSSSVLQWKFHF
jgi:hypothetical protein